MVQVTKEDVLDLIKKIPQDQIITEIGLEQPLVWIHKNITTEKGEKLDFQSRPYLVDIVEDFSSHIVYKKGAQVGITMCGGICKNLYACDQLGITSIYTFPTASDVNKFSKARFTFIVRNSKYLQSRISGFDSAQMKQIGDATLYFSGTWTDRQAISVPSDLNIHDELDFSKPDVRDIYTTRLDASEFMYKGEMQYGWEWDFSTPTLPKFGIDALYERSDKHVWRVQCTGCNKRQQIDFFKNIGKKGKTWIWACRKCGKSLDVLNGKWRALKPQAEIRGYHIPQTICRWIKPEKLVKQYKEAKKKGNLKKFTNFNLALAYESGDDVITAGLIKSRIVPGTKEQGDIYIGCDQGDTLHFEITKAIDGRRRVIAIGTVDSFHEFEQLLLHYKPRIAVLDALPNHHNARELARKHHNLYICNYGGTKKLEKEDWEKDLEKKEVTVPRTDVLDLTAALWVSGETVIEDYISPTMIDDFAEQMENEKRDMEERPDGEKIIKWVNTGNSHFRHADVYNWIAMEIGSRGKSDVMAASEPYTEFSIGESLFTDGDAW